MTETPTETATESFVEKPQVLARRHPELYDPPRAGYTAVQVRA